jgi:hypothetical protein
MRGFCSDSRRFSGAITWRKASHSTIDTHEHIFHNTESLAGTYCEDVLEMPMSTDEQQLLDHVPADGTGIGNKSLRELLGWDEDKYWKIRDTLVDGEIIRLGRGKGGSVARILAQTEGTSQSINDSTLPPAEISEDALYEPLEIILRDKWCKELRFDEFVIQITARQGRRETGGKWTRPDIVVVSVVSYLNLPGKHVDVITFEVKTHENFDVSSVYEALAHLRAATRAYLVVCVPKDNRDSLEPVIEVVTSECSRHGVGFIVVPGDISSYDTWEFLVDASPAQGNPARIDDFLERQLSEDNKRRLRRYIH